MTNSGGAAGARRVCICDSEVSYGEISISTRAERLFSSGRRRIPQDFL